MRNLINNFLQVFKAINPTMNMRVLRRELKFILLSIISFSFVLLYRKVQSRQYTRVGDKLRSLMQRVFIYVFCYHRKTFAFAKLFNLDIATIFITNVGLSCDFKFSFSASKSSSKLTSVSL